MIIKASLGIASSFCLALFSHSAFCTTPSESDLTYGQWYGQLGAHGLRRSLANFSDLGELANRTATYRISKQQQRIHLAQQSALPGTPAPFTYESDFDGIVAQLGTMTAITPQFGRHTALEGMVRRAVRDGDDLDVTSDHLDIGLVWQANIFSHRAGYFALHGFYDKNRADILFVDGERVGDNIGARVQFGEVLGSTWAYSLKLERAKWQGDSESYRPSMSGPILVTQPVDYTRTYFNGDIIGRFSLDNFFIDNTRLRWRSGIYYLQNDYEDQINSLDQPVVEPFGATERLGFLRTGAHLSWVRGEQNQWNPFIELMYDYEFKNNMNDVIDDPHNATIKLGLAWLPKRGYRYQFEVQRYQGFEGERARNNITLTVLLDHF
ncbi:hypothetical protein [Aurantivibrio plasticivorans]